MTPLKESTHIQSELHLSFLDQQPHIRVYGRYYIIFPFPSSPSSLDCISSATHALRTGFEQVLERFPYLAGTVTISPTNNEDQLQVLYPDPIDAEKEAKRIFTNKTVQSEELSYTLLAKSHFLPNLLPVKTFCPKLIAHHEGLDEGDAYAERVTTFSSCKGSSSEDREGEGVENEGGRLPAFACQATFIPGGLVLSVWFLLMEVEWEGSGGVE
jgi:hypothetical protein